GQEQPDPIDPTELPLQPMSLYTPGEGDTVTRSELTDLLGADPWVGGTTTTPGLMIEPRPAPLDVSMFADAAKQARRERGGVRKNTFLDASFALLTEAKTYLKANEIPYRQVRTKDLSVAAGLVVGRQPFVPDLIANDMKKLVRDGWLAYHKPGYKVTW